MNTSYTPHTFDFHPLEGISEKTMEVHLGLYEGYVKNTNKVLGLIDSLSGEENAYALNEARRRFSFEFGGMRNHEYFFEQLTGGAQPIDPESALGKKIVEDFGSIDQWRKDFESLKSMRGIGFIILYYDKEEKRLLNSWIEEQHLGHLNSAQWIFGVDLWEHAFLFDFAPSEKAAYVETVFKNSNFRVPEERFENASA